MVNPVSTRVEDGVGVLALQDAESRNALDDAVVRQLEEGLANLGENPAVNVVVLEGLPEVFCSGASRDLLRALADGTRRPTELLLPRRILAVPVPVIAAMQGHAIGGGLAYGICADIVLVARESRYGLTFMNFGFTPGMGTTRLLEQFVSPAIAHEMMYSGHTFKGSHFEGRSGFNYVLPQAEVVSKAHDIAQRIAEKPRPALEALKRTLSLAKRELFEQAYTLETLMHQVTFGSEVSRRLGEEPAI